MDSAIVFGICYVSLPSDTVNFYFQGVLKIHVVCLMAVVISRRKIAGRSINEVSQSRLRLREAGSNFFQESYELPRSNLKITVETQTYVQESGPVSSSTLNWET